MAGTNWRILIYLEDNFRLTNNSVRVFRRHSSAVPVKIKMTMFGKPNSEVEIRLDELNLDARVQGGVV